MDEYADPERQLHRHVPEPTRPGDVVVVDARGSMTSGVFGEMMPTSFTGAVAPESSSTAAFATSQKSSSWDRFVVARRDAPFPRADRCRAVRGQCAIAYGGTAVEPGDIIVDDDGAVVVSIALARVLLGTASARGLGGALL